MNQTLSQNKNPEWWTDEQDTAWERVKLAMKRDWDQTKHDFGGSEPDTNQNIGNTTRQAGGNEAIPPRGQPTYEELEPAYRFGYGARSNYGDEYPDWDDDLEARLEEDWRALDPNYRNPNLDNPNNPGNPNYFSNTNNLNNVNNPNNPAYNNADNPNNPYSGNNQFRHGPAMTNGYYGNPNFPTNQDRHAYSLSNGYAWGYSTNGNLRSGYFGTNRYSGSPTNN